MRDSYFVPIFHGLLFWVYIALSACLTINLLLLIVHVSAIATTGDSQPDKWTEVIFLLAPRTGACVRTRMLAHEQFHLLLPKRKRGQQW